MQFQAALMGVNFRGKEVSQLVAALPVGETAFTFERDPENAYDPNAVKVLYGGDPGEFIGFVAKEVAEEIAPLMDSGYTVTGKIIDFLGMTKPFMELELTMPEDDEDEEPDEDDNDDEADDEAPSTSSS